MHNSVFLHILQKSPAYKGGTAVLPRIQDLEPVAYLEEFFKWGGAPWGWEQRQA